MNHNFCLSRFRRALAFFFAAVFVCVSVIASNVVPVSAAGNGWVEITAQAPEELSSYVILSLVEDKTQEEYDFPVLRENNFHVFEEIPTGSYTVAGAWVYQDYRYAVACNVDKFEVKDNDLITINLTVGQPGEEVSIPSSEVKEESSEAESSAEEEKKAEEEEKEEAPVEKDDLEKDKEKDASDSSEQNKERPIWVNIIITVVGVLVFAGIFFGIYYISRLKYR